MSATHRQEHAQGAQATLNGLRVSPRKLNLLAELIREKPIAEAERLLRLSKKRVSHDVLKLVRSAKANAVQNHQMNAETLYVYHATVGRAFSLKRTMVRGRGRINSIEKPFSNMCVKLRSYQTEV